MNVTTADMLWKNIQMKPSWLPLVEKASGMEACNAAVRKATDMIAWRNPVGMFVDTYPDWAIWALAHRLIPDELKPHVNGIIRAIADRKYPLAVIEYLCEFLSLADLMEYARREGFEPKQPISPHMHQENVVRWALRRPAEAIESYAEILPSRLLKKCAHRAPKTALINHERLCRAAVLAAAHRRSDLALQHAPGRLDTKDLVMCAKRHPDIALKYAEPYLPSDMREWCIAKCAHQTQ